MRMAQSVWMCGVLAFVAYTTTMFDSNWWLLALLLILLPIRFPIRSVPSDS